MNGAEDSITLSPISQEGISRRVEDPIFKLAEAKFEETPSVRSEIVERTVNELIELEPTFTQHEAVTGIPFSASFYKLDKVYDDIDTKDRINARNIDEYIMKQVFSNKLDDEASSVHKYMKDLENEIGLKDYHSPYYKLDKLAKYIKAIQDFGNFASIKKRLFEESNATDH